MPFDQDTQQSKMEMLEKVTDGLIPNRWKASRTPTDADVRSTGVIKMRVESGSAKCRSGGPKDEAKVG